MRLIAVKDLYFLSIICLIWIASWLPSRAMIACLARSVAFLAYKLSGTKRRFIEKNLSQAFDGKLREDQRRTIVKGVFYTFWRDVFSWLPSRAERAALKLAEVRGEEHLHEALKNGKGVILWETSGFARRFVAKQILHQKGFAVHQVHGPFDMGGFRTDDSSATLVRRSLIKRFFEDRERQCVAEIINIPRSNSLAYMRVILARLKENCIICISSEGKHGQKLIPIRFLGGDEVFSTGMVSLARKSGAPILPIFCIQERSGQTTLIIERPVPIENDLDRERAVETSLTQYARLLETYIKQYPEQYRNWHLLRMFARQQAFSQDLYRVQV